MKIWHVTTEIALPEDYTGGMGCHVYNVAKEQAAIGHDVIVFCPLMAAEEVNGVRYMPWETRVSKFQSDIGFKLEVKSRMVDKLFALGLRERPDIIHCHEWDAAPAALRAAKYLQVPNVATLHISNILNQPYMSAWHTEVEHYHLWWEQEMMRMADGMIAISDYYAGWMKMLGCQKPIRRIHNGVNVDDFQNGVTREKPDGRTLAFFHGRLCGQKGLDIIVEAARQRDDIYWVIAGPIAADKEGPCLEDHLLKDLRGLEAEGKVLLTGMIPQTEIGAWLRCCDVAVYPHKRAPFDCAVLEAMACGACVITTGVDAIAEYADNDSALFISPKARLLLLAIDGLVCRPSERNAYKATAKLKASQFTWQKTAIETLDYYEEIINANKDNLKHHASA